MQRFFSPLLSAVAAFTIANIAQADDGAAYEVIDEGAAQLREDFNAAKGTVRLLFVVDPICPGCLRGLDDMNKDLLVKTTDPRMQTFVVHVPVLTPPPEADDVPEAATLLDNANVRHYWNPSGSFGWELAAAAGLKHGDETVYAWDVWLVYGPDAIWDEAYPPQPQLLVHQLFLLDGSEFPPLDSEVFAKEVRELLARLP